MNKDDKRSPQDDFAAFFETVAGFDLKTGTKGPATSSCPSSGLDCGSSTRLTILAPTYSFIQDQTGMALVEVAAGREHSAPYAGSITDAAVASRAAACALVKTSHPATGPGRPTKLSNLASLFPTTPSTRRNIRSLDSRWRASVPTAGRPRVSRRSAPIVISHDALKIYRANRTGSSD